MKRRLLPILAALLAAITQPSCEALKDVPITVAYKADIAGHDLTASYNKKGGLSIAAEHLRVLTGK